VAGLLKSAGVTGGRAGAAVRSDPPCPGDSPWVGAGAVGAGAVDASALGTGLDGACGTRRSCVSVPCSVIPGPATLGGAAVLSAACGLDPLRCATGGPGRGPVALGPVGRTGEGGRSAPGVPGTDGLGGCGRALSDFCLDC
jgi:hypothetical protein